MRERRPDLDLTVTRPLLNRIAQAISNFHRDAIFQFIQVFFYGLFMDVDLLRSKCAEPLNVRAASVPGFPFASVNGQR